MECKGLNQPTLKLAWEYLLASDIKTLICDIWTLNFDRVSSASALVIPYQLLLVDLTLNCMLQSLDDLFLIFPDFICRENFKLFHGFSFSLMSLIQILYQRKGLNLSDAISC